MHAAVDLDQLAKPSAPLAHLEHPLAPALLRTPQSQAKLNLPYRLSRNLDALVLEKLLSRKRWTEVRIAVPKRPLDPADHTLVQPVV